MTPPCRSRTKRSTSRSTTLADVRRSTAASPSGCGRPTGRGTIRGMVSITARPAEVEDRKGPGHWEGDLVTGTRPSAAATLVERTSRCTAIVALPDGIKAEQVTPHLTRSLLGIPPRPRRTLTWDRGRETAEHQAITAETRMPIYLCKPRSPWQRGTDENTNRLLRQYLPKGADLRTFGQADLDAIAHELNHPRVRTHGYRTPAEGYAHILNSGDALTARARQGLSKVMMCAPVTRAGSTGSCQP
ncbi:IS30 family transposase [Streptomyces goshikiensis]|uniref:IS30 family transposase n=1 Tax=Streptomyces goshikiensis TaxID=1942 RepID=UPI0036547D3F